MLYKIIFSLLLGFLLTTFAGGAGGAVVNNTLIHTFTIDTTSHESSADTLRFLNAYGCFNVSITPDSTGADEGATDTLQFQYRMLAYDNIIWRLMHSDWLTAEIYNGSVWVTVLNWTDATAYLVDLPNIDVCDGIEAKIVLGTGDSLMVSIPVIVKYQKQQ